MAPVTDVERGLRALADKNRLRILKMLECKNMCVCEMAAVLGIKQPSVSRHLKKMKMAGLIAEKQSSFFTEYFLLKNSRLKAIWRAITSELDRDEQIRKDRRKARKANRYSIKRTEKQAG